MDHQLQGVVFHSGPPAGRFNMVDGNLRESGFKAENTNKNQGVSFHGLGIWFGKDIRKKTI
jgi:hypothetical protein